LASPFVRKGDGPILAGRQTLPTAPGTLVLSRAARLPAGDRTLARAGGALSPRPETKGYMYTTWGDNYDNIGLFMTELK